MTAQSVNDLLKNKNLGASALLQEFIGLLPALSVETRSRLLEDLKQQFPLMAVWHFAVDYFGHSTSTPQTIKDFGKFVNSAQSDTVQKALALLGSYHRFATLSRSSLVERTLIQIGNQKNIQVLCANSLPAEEGVDLYRSLSGTGISSRCVSDWEMSDQLDGIEALLLGADWITETECINKWGSGALLQSAQENGIPVFIIAEKFKHRTPVSWREEDFYQDWSKAGIGCKIKVFERCSLTPEICVI